MNSNMNALLPRHEMFAAWGALLAQWLKRSPDVLRVNTTEMDSPYVKVSLLVNKANEVAYVSNDVDTEGEILFGALPLPLDVVPVFSVTLLTYGEVSTGTRIINASRCFEAQDLFFVAGDIGGLDKDGNERGDMFQTICVWERQRSKDAPEAYDGFLYVDSKVSFEYITVTALNSAIDKTISRINSGKPSVDTRTETWNGNTVTAYGKYKRQQASEAKARREAKAAARKTS